eukprot:SAG22_NODE_467_length_10171_cov_4.306295_17_plen_94_part_00
MRRAGSSELTGRAASRRLFPVRRSIGGRQMTPCDYATGWSLAVSGMPGQAAGAIVQMPLFDLAVGESSPEESSHVSTQLSPRPSTDFFWRPSC